MLQYKFINQPFRKFLMQKEVIKNSQHNRQSSIIILVFKNKKLTIHQRFLIQIKCRVNIIISIILDNIFLKL